VFIFVGVVDVDVVAVGVVGVICFTVVGIVGL
jgi:hypothetical protein